MVLLSRCCRALWVWRRFKSRDPLARGVNCAVFRNEGAGLASALVLLAEVFAVRRWGAVHAYTYVDAAAVRSVNPGYCFRRAGWRRTRRTQGGLIVLEKDLC